MGISTQMCDCVDGGGGGGLELVLYVPDLKPFKNATVTFLFHIMYLEIQSYSPTALFKRGCNFFEVWCFHVIRHKKKKIRLFEEGLYFSIGSQKQGLHLGEGIVQDGSLIA